MSSPRSLRSSPRSAKGSRVSMSWSRLRGLAWPRFQTGRASTQVGQMLTVSSFQTRSPSSRCRTTPPCRSPDSPLDFPPTTRRARESAGAATCPSRCCVRAAATSMVCSSLPLFVCWLVLRCMSRVTRSLRQPCRHNPLSQTLQGNVLFLSHIESGGLRFAGMVFNIAASS